MLSFNFNTTKSSFQAFHDVLDYRTSHNTNSDLKYEVDSNYFKFKCLKTMEYPMISELGKKVALSFPEKITFDFKGTMDSTGKGVIITSLSEEYKDYVVLRETMKFDPSGSVQVILEYKIIPYEDDSLFGYLKNAAYNSAVALVETQIFDLYTTRRNRCFNYTNPKKVTGFEDLGAVKSAPTDES